MSINGTPVGSYSHLGKTFTLVDESGTELVGVIVDNETVFTATADDIKIGKIAATETGVTEGTDTRTYRTLHSSYMIFPGENFSIPLEEYDMYDYTKLQTMIAEFNTSFNDSTCIVKVSLNDQVFNVGSIEKVADVTKNMSTKSVDLNIVNNTDNIFIIHFNTFKEE